MKQHETLGIPFEVKMRATRPLPDGDRKSITHVLMVEAFNFGQAERNARQVFAALWPDDTSPFAISIRITSRKEYLRPDEATPAIHTEGTNILPGTWYQTIVEWRELDETSGRDRRQRQSWLVSTDQGTDNVNEIISTHLSTLGITKYKLRRIELTDIEAVTTLK